MGDMGQSATYRWWYITVGLRAIGEVLEKMPNPIASGIGHVITKILSNTTVEIATGGVAGRAVMKQYGIGLALAGKAPKTQITVGAGGVGTEGKG
jgi:hypothetical protein